MSEPLTGTGADLHAYLIRAEADGSLPQHSAITLRSYAKAVLCAVAGDAWAQVDLGQLDVVAALGRFEELRRARGSTRDSIKTMKSGFTRALRRYRESLADADDPNLPRPPRSVAMADAHRIPASSARLNWVAYPLALKRGDAIVLAMLHLSADLTQWEAERIGVHVKTLCVESAWSGELL